MPRRIAVAKPVLESPFVSTRFTLDQREQAKLTSSKCVVRGQASLLTQRLPSAGFDWGLGTVPPRFDACVEVPVAPICPIHASDHRRLL